MGVSLSPLEEANCVITRPRLSIPAIICVSGFHATPNGVELACRTQLLVLLRDEIGICLHENLARRAEIKLVGLVAEELAMDTGPDKAPVGIDIHLGHSKLRGWEVFVLVYAAGARVEFAPGGVDPLDFFFRHARAAVHDDRQPGNLVADFLDNVEVQPLFASKLIGSMTGADGRSQGIAAGLFHKLDRLVWIRETSMSFINFDVFFDTAKHSQLGFDADALRVGALNHALRDSCVFSKRLMAGVNHHRAVEPRIDAIITGLLIAVIKMDGENRVRKNLFRRPDDRLEHA